MVAGSWINWVCLKISVKSQSLCILTGPGWRMDHYCERLISTALNPEGEHRFFVKVSQKPIQPNAPFTRSGYPLLVISRRELLRTLYNGIPEKRSIQFDCKVVRVTSNPSGVILHCADASVIRGSAVVGSDGIHSFTRREMMRHIRDCKPGRLSPEIQTRGKIHAVDATSQSAKTPRP